MTRSSADHHVISDVVAHDRPSILYLIDSLALGGAERSLVDMAPHLLAAGVDLTVAVLHDRPGLAGELELHGVPVIAVDGTNRATWLVSVVKLLRRLRPELLHTTLFEADLVGRTAAALCRIPVVSTLANTPYGPEQLAEGSVSEFKLRSAQIADAVSAKFVRRFHAVSQSAADAYVARLRLRPERVDVIPRGRDLARLGKPSPTRRHDVRVRLGLPPNAVVLLAVARQEPQKGLDVLIRSLPSVIARCASVLVIVAGREGRATDELQRIRDELGVERHINFLGERDDIGDLLSTADAFVLPSRREGLPGSILEAMAMEVPVIASDLPTVREAVPDERFAVLVPSGDPLALGRSLVSALENREVAARMTAAARARFEERFEIAAVSASMVRFYRRALSARR
jgi:glycosyltransferase involved in cell wall biosynthesis